MARKQSKGSLSKTSFVCILHHILPIGSPVIIAGIPAVIGIPTGIPAVIIPVAVITAVIIGTVVRRILKIIIFRTAVIAVGIIVTLVIAFHPGFIWCIAPGIILPFVPVPMIIVIVLILIGVIAVIRSVVNLPDRIGACKIATRDNAAMIRQKIVRTVFLSFCSGLFSYYRRCNLWLGGWQVPQLSAAGVLSALPLFPSSSGKVR